MALVEKPLPEFGGEALQVWSAMLVAQVDGYTATQTNPVSKYSQYSRNCLPIAMT